MPFKLVTEQIYLSRDEYIINDMLNEGFKDSLQSSIDKIIDKKKALLNVIKRFNEETNIAQKKMLAKVIVMLFLTIYGSSKIYQEVSDDSKKKDNVIENIIKDTKTSVEKVYNYFDDLLSKEEVKKEVKAPIVKKFNEAKVYKTSDTAKELIKKYEKLSLVGYDLHDGKITIGWGHAEPKKTSKYKIGQKITRAEAERLFNEDILIAENGVKRIFRDWAAKGNVVEITQGMFDSMVSIAYNAGVQGLRTSTFIQLIKKKKFIEAKKDIINIRNTGKYRGITPRRKDEQILYST